MARRKKLNVRLILILSAVLAVLLVLGGYGGYKRGWHRKIIRVDPVEASRKALAAQEKGDYDEAQTQLLRAVRFAPTATAKADYYYQFAKLHLEWLDKRREQLTDSQRVLHFTQARSGLQQALVQDNTHLDSQRLLTELMWGAAQHGDWMTYIREADALLKLDPNDHRTTFLRALSWAALARGVPGTNSENAIRDFRQAIELKGDETDYHQEYTRFLQQEGRLDEAVTAFEDAVKKLPNDGNLRVQYAALLMSKDRPQPAMVQIQEAIVRDPNNPIGNLALASRLLKEEKMNEALAALDKAKQIDDSDYRIYNMLSYVYLTQNQSEKSLSSLRDGLAVIDKKLADAATTSPASSQVRNFLSINRYQLLALLGNTLLEEARRADDAKRPQLFGDVRNVLDQMTADVGMAGEREKIAGRLAFLEGNFAEAQPLLEKAYQILGPDPPLADALVKIYIRRNLPGKAEQILDVMRRYPAFANDKRILMAKAQLGIQYRDFGQAQQLIEQVLRADPNDAEAKNLLHLLDVMKGSVSIEDVLAAKEVTPGMVAALLDRVQALWINDERTEAIAFLERLHAKVPGNEMVRQNLLACYVGVEDMAKAKGILTEIKTTHPERSAILELQEKFIDEKDRQKRFQLTMQLADLVPDPVGRALEKASFCARYGDTEGQGNYLREAYQLKPDEPIVVDHLMSYALTRKDWNLAEECVQTATKFNLDRAEGKVFAARLAMAKEDFPKAIEALTQTVNKEPDVKMPWLMLGECYNMTGDVEQAEKAFMTLVRADPGYVPALVAMATLTQREGKMEEHAMWVERAYRLAPTHPYIQQRYLTIMEGKASDDEIIGQRERLMRLNPSNLFNRLRLARLYEKKDQIEKAEELYKSIYAENQDKLAGGHILAAFYVRNGRASEAQKVLDDLMQTWPDKVAVYLLYADYLSDTNPEQARASIDKAIELGPKDPRGYRSLASFLMQNNDLNSAVDALSKYLELQPDDIEAAKEQIICYMEMGQFSQAEQKNNVLLASDPSNPDLLNLQGNLAMRQGNVAQAMEAFDRALQIKPDHLEALLGQVNAFIVQGKTTDAKMAMTKARGLSKDPRLAMALKTMHMRMGDVDMAVMVLREVLSDPNTTTYAPAMKELLRIYELQQRWPKVTELLTEAKAKFPNDPYYLVIESRVNRLTGNPAKAVAAMEEAMKLAPMSRELLRGYLLALLETGDFHKILAVSEGYKDNPVYGVMEIAIRGQAMAKLNRFDQAAAVFLDAFKAASFPELAMVMDRFKQSFGPNVAMAKVAEWAKTGGGDPLFYFLLGVLHREAQDYPKAIEALTQANALAAKPKDKAVVDLELGLAYYESRNFPEAEKAYLASLQASGDDPITLNNLAFMYIVDMDQPDKALPYAAKAAQKAPTSADILDTYGWALAKTGSYDQAEKILVRALQLSTSPTSAAYIRYHQGWVCEQAHRPEEAARYYRQVDEILTDPNDPLHKDVSEALKRVQQTPSTKP